MEFKVGDVVYSERKSITGVIVIVPTTSGNSYIVEITEGEWAFSWPGFYAPLDENKQYTHCGPEDIRLVTTTYPRIKTTFLEGVEL